jgi:hypothetical protein
LHLAHLLARFVSRLDICICLFHNQTAILSGFNVRQWGPAGFTLTLSTKDNNLYLYQKRLLLNTDLIEMAYNHVLGNHVKKIFPLNNKWLEL